MPPAGEGLKAGNVITVEPGIYFVDSLLKKAAADPTQAALLNLDIISEFRQEVGGVRIEDNVAILPCSSSSSGFGGDSSSGVLNITMAADVPKAVHLIEQEMACR